MLDNQVISGNPEKLPIRESLFSIHCDEQLKAYFHSFYTYLTVPENPNIRLIELKFRELVLLAGTASNKTLTNYFASLCRNEKPPLQEIMEDNFNYPMSLEEYARLCGHSLSSFKREFKETFGTTPGRWLTQKRLELAKYLLENTGKSVMETALDSGFNNHSHFSRIFKEKFGMPPLQMARN